MTRGSGQVHEPGCAGSTALLVLAPAYYGLATLAAGAGMTTVGSIMFAHNRVHFQHSEDPGPLETSARISVLPMPQGGLGLGATVAF
jgi:hypothetical protein